VSVRPPRVAAAAPSAPSPATASTVDEAELSALRDAGRAWATLPRARAGGARAVDPDLAAIEERGTLPGDRRVRVSRAHRSGLEKVAPGHLQTTPRSSDPATGARARLARLRRFVVGAPLATRQMVHERLTKVKALAVLSSDALSSVAYATEQILSVLLLAGAVAYGYSQPIMGAILALLAIVVLSYRQTIRAYPRGGGSYIVASDNLGPYAGLIAGCALMTSYVLTVAVSVAAGVDAIISAAPATADYRVVLCVAFIASSSRFEAPTLSNIRVRWCLIVSSLTENCVAI